MSALKTVIRLVRRGIAPSFFPEGGRTPDGRSPARPARARPHHRQDPRARWCRCASSAPTRLFPWERRYPSRGRSRIVVGEPIHFTEADLVGSGRDLYQKLSERVMEHIAAIQLPSEKRHLPCRRRGNGPIDWSSPASPILHAPPRKTLPRPPVRWAFGLGLALVLAMRRRGGIYDSGITGTSATSRKWRLPPPSATRAYCQIARQAGRPLGLQYHGHAGHGVETGKNARRPPVARRQRTTAGHYWLYRRMNQKRHSKEDRRRKPAGHYLPQDRGWTNTSKSRRGRSRVRAIRRIYASALRCTQTLFTSPSANMIISANEPL